MQYVTLVTKSVYSGPRGGLEHYMQAPEPERGSVDSSMVDYIPQGTHKLEYTVKWYEPRDDTSSDPTLDLSIN